MPRANASGTLSFGLVAVPVKFFTACASEQARFSMITPKGNKVKQQYVDVVTGDLVDAKDCLKGFEHTKGQFVTFSAEEIKSLEAERTNTIDIIEFVPESSVDLVGVEKSYYLGPDKGGDKPYLLLSEIMREQGKVAVGRWAARGKEQLVVIRSYGERGLVLHQMFYANEVRNFHEVEETVAKFTITDREKEMAGALVEQLSSDEFDTGKYKDEYLHRINAAVQQKLAGEEITVIADQPKAAVLDLFAALKASLDSAKEKKPEPKDTAKETKPVKQNKKKKTG